VFPATASMAASLGTPSSFEGIALGAVEALGALEALGTVEAPIFIGEKPLIWPELETGAY